LSEELIQEGIARELVNRIQNLRKDSGFEVTDKIKVTIQTSEGLEKAIQANRIYIMSETLTEVLEFEEDLNDGTSIEFDGIITKILITK
jgi:isoleucyl-tRNA synthetase